MTTGIRPEPSPIQKMIQSMLMVQDMKRQAAMDELTRRQVETQELVAQAELAGLLNEEGRNALAGGDKAGVLRNVAPQEAAVRGRMLEAGAGAVSPDQYAVQALLGMTSGQMAAENLFVDAIANLDPANREFLSQAMLAQRLTGQSRGQMERERIYMTQPEEKKRKAADIEMGLDLSAESMSRLNLERDISVMRAKLERDSMALQERLGLKKMSLDELALKLNMAGMEVERMKAMAQLTGQTDEDFLKNWELINSMTKNLQSATTTTSRRALAIGIAEGLARMGMPLSEEALRDLSSEGTWWQRGYESTTGRRPSFLDPQKKPENKK